MADVTSFGTALSISSSGMDAQAQRLRHVSENIANADTPGYHRKVVSFEDVSAGFGPDHSMGLGDGQGVSVGDVSLDPRAPQRQYAPGHPMADQSGYVDGSNVDLVIEIADAREAQRSYEANLRMFDQARQMSSAVLDILRR